MNPTQDLSILSLILNASLLVQAVMVLLLGLSVASWTIIFRTPGQSSFEKDQPLEQFGGRPSALSGIFGQVAI